MYKVIVAAAIIAGIGIAILASRPPVKTLTTASWPQIEVQKTDRIITGSIPR
ncbi:hypothetical protein [Rhizobium binxianense]